MKLYRLLLRILPISFRNDFEGEMEQVFRDQQADARRRGAVGLLKLWWETILGLFHTGPVEHLQLLRQDLSYAFRMMRKNWGYTTLAVVTLALGIGATTSIFSVINAILIRPLPYRQGQELVVVRQQAPKAGVADTRFSVPEILDYTRQNHTLSGVAEYHSMAFTMLGHGDAQRVRTGVVSASFFDMFGVKPLLGRTFVPQDDEPGAPAALILSYEYWLQHEGGDPGVIGKVFELNDRVHTVVGVLPPVPQYPNDNDVYMPVSACPFRSNPRTIRNREGRFMSVFGRLSPGVSLETANADLAVIADRLQKEYPQSYTREMGYRAISARLEAELTREARPTLYVLLGATFFVLLVACANVANLTMARMAGREHELMVRTALGAGQGRLLRQLVTESLLIGLLASALGLLLASQSLDLLKEFASRLTPRAREIRVDGVVLGFTLLAALLTSLVFGSLAAFHSREEVATGLKEGGRSTGGVRRGRLRKALIVCQVAFSFVLLAGAGLMLRSLNNLRRVDPGFVPQRALAMRLNLNWSKYVTVDKVRDAGRRILDAVEGQPGVLSAAISSGFPLDPESIAAGPFTRPFQVEGRVAAGGESAPVSSTRSASPDYFKTLGIRLLAGRLFTAADDEHAPRVAVANRALARHYWPNEDPVGKRVSFDNGETWTQIIGVAGDVKEFGLDREPAAEIYLPTAQSPGAQSLIVRTAQDPAALANQIRRAIAGADAQTAVSNIQTLEQARAKSIAAPRVTSDLLGLFAVLALLIAASGIGGILALGVSERIQEIGIRLALGARTAHVLGSVLGQGAALVAAGVGIGCVCALAATRMLGALLFEVRPADPLTYVGVAFILTAAALGAAYAPARRATKIDPLLALRGK